MLVELERLADDSEYVTCPHTNRLYSPKECRTLCAKFNGYKTVENTGKRYVLCNYRKQR